MMEWLQFFQVATSVLMILLPLYLSHPGVK